MLFSYYEHMDQSDLNQQLEGLGWTKEEATLYLTLLELGSQPASIIASHLKRNRVTVYHALDRLVQKKMVEKSYGKHGAYFKAKSPQFLLQQLKEERNKVIRDRDYEIKGFEWLLPHLNELKTEDPLRPRVQLFHDDPLKQIYQLSLETSFMVAYFQPWPKDQEKELNEIDDWHTQERVKRQIPVKIIIPQTKEGVAFAAIQKDLKETLLVPPSLFPFQDITLITDDRILIFSQKERLGISLESKHLADNQRAIFNLAWEGAKALLKS